MKDFSRGVKNGLAIGLGYLSVAFSFGINAAGGGLSILQAVIISASNITSAGQVAGLESMMTLAPLMEVALVQLMINIRYSLMSISLSQKLDASMTTGNRMIFAFCNTDEVFAVASSQQGLLNKNYLFGLIVMPILGWVSGTFLGAAAGTLLPASVTTALGIAIYGMFIAIVIPPARKLKAVRVVLVISVTLSCLIYYVPGLNRISSGFSIIICALIASLVGAWLFPVKEDA